MHNEMMSDSKLRKRLTTKAYKLATGNGLGCTLLELLDKIGFDDAIMAIGPQVPRSREEQEIGSLCRELLALAEQLWERKDCPKEARIGEYVRSFGLDFSFQRTLPAHQTLWSIGWAARKAGVPTKKCAEMMRFGIFTTTVES